jgi:hypothetical protein
VCPSAHSCRQKIKCDETKPSCRQCTKRKVACPGYKRDLRWSDKHEVFAAPKGANIPVPKVLPVILDDDVGGPAEQVSSPEIARQSVSIVPAQSLGSATDASYAASMSQTPSQQADKADAFAFQPASSEYDDGSSSAVFRNDLREWLATHEPITLLGQQDWQWHAETPPAYTATVDRAGTAASHGSEFNQALVEYFFANLCSIHSVLDDTAERFTALVHRYLTSSPLLHKSIVCMSAAHCFQDDDAMLPICLEVHSAAVRSLSQAVFQIEAAIEQSADSPQGATPFGQNMLRKLEETLLASIILGFCAVSGLPLESPCAFALLRRCGLAS